MRKILEKTLETAKKTETNMFEFFTPKFAIKVFFYLAAKRATGTALHGSRLFRRHPKVCKFMKRFLPYFIIHHFDDICDFGQNFIELAT